MRSLAFDTRVFIGLVLLLACTTWGTAQNTDYERIALLKWYPAIQSTSAFGVGPFPAAVAFDGGSIWVPSFSTSSVTKLRVADGATLGTFSVGQDPLAVAFDGASIWVVNSGSNNVTKLRAADGAVQGTFSVGMGPEGVAFDGANIWVTSYYRDFVTKL